MSPELEFCDLAAMLVRLVRPELVIETGVGQGFLTRRVVAQLEQGQHLVGYEADSAWRERLQALELFGNGLATISEKPSPSEDKLRGAQVTILDSGWSHRVDEVRAWASAGPPGSLVLVHDCGNGHASGSGHAKLAKLVEKLEIPGVFLRNPRGAFLGLGGAALQSRLDDAQNRLDDAQNRLDKALRAAARSDDQLQAIKASRSYRYTSVARKLWARLPLGAVPPAR